jgi:hypothetical protein
MTLSAYQQRAYDQGVAWVRGEAKHNDVDDECCPDFSCCIPQLFEADRAVRKTQFAKECERHGWPKQYGDN